MSKESYFYIVLNEIVAARSFPDLAIISSISFCHELSLAILLYFSTLYF